MASSFLKRLAEEKARQIDKTSGASAYGGSSSLRSSARTAPNGGGNGAPVTRASNFLTQLAQKRSAGIDKEYGSDAYGGSQWTALDKESSFNDWLESLTDFSKRMSEDYAGRDGKYQSADSFGKYRDDAFASIGAMQGRSDIYRSYFENNRELYGDDAVDRILSTLDEGGSHLEALRGGLGSEYDYWSQWATEKDYTDYQRRSAMDVDSARRELAELQEQLSQTETERNTSRNIMVGARYMTARQRQEYGASKEEAEARYNDLQGRISALQEDIEGAERIAKGKQYRAYREAEDFKELSQYAPTANGKEAKFNALSGMYSETGFSDITYDYINRNQTARDHQMVNDISSNASLLGVDQGFLQEMTDEEIATFNYLYATQGADPAYEYISFLASDLNYRQRVQSEEAWAAYAKEHPVGSSVFSVLESPMKGLSYIGQLADYTADGKIDQNAAYNKFSYLNSAIRGEVTSIVEDRWGGVGSFAYQTGMSMGDFLLNTAITGGNQALTLGIMGTGAAADATIAAKDRGLSDDQAFALGTIAGAAEIITEKVSLDALLDKTSLARSAIGYFLKNTLAEGSEEVGSDLINLFADILIAKDKSEWQVSIDAYKSEGMDDTEAFWHSVLDQAQVMGLDFLGGAVSGGVLSGGSIAINATGSNINARQTGGAFNAMGDDVVLATIKEGLASDPSTKSYQLAQHLQQKLESGGTITNTELGKLYQANVQAIDAETGSGDLLLRAAKELTERGRVTNTTASDILGNPNAMNRLTQEAGLTLTEDMSKSQRRSAIKSAVEGLASREGGFSVNAGETAPGQASAAQTATQQSHTQTPAQHPQGARSIRMEAEPPTAAQQVHNIQSVERATQALGEHGAKVATDFYDGGTDATAYYGAFSSYYQAGATGLDIGKVQTMYADALNSAQRKAAYLAGQTDAAVSLSAEKDRVQYATVYGSEAGLIQNDHIAALPQTQAVYLNRLGRALGTKIEMTAAVEHGGNGAYYASQGTIRIAANAKDPALVIAAHEITHRIQDLAPEAYRTYRDYANGKIAEQVGRDAVEEIRDRYARNGVNLTTEQAMDEVAAEFTEAMVKDGKLFKDLAQDKRSVARKVLDAIRDFLSKVKDVFKGDTTAQNSAAMEQYGVDMKTLEQAAHLWNEALKEASTEAKHRSVVGTEGGYAQVDGKFSLKGVVEDNGELVAIHNLTAVNLREALALGGLPMPSIAIVQARQGHAKYGPISLVFDKATIDPRANKKNKVYGGDAWTPTAPRMEYPVNYPVVRTFERNITELSKRIADGIFSRYGVFQSMGVDDTSYVNAYDLTSQLIDNETVRAAYLSDRGETLEPVMKDTQYSRYGNDVVEAYLAAVDADRLRQVSDNVFEGGDHAWEGELDTIREILRLKWSQGFDIKPELVEKRLSRVNRDMVESIIKGAWALNEDGAQKSDEVDYHATKEALYAATNEAREEIRAWLDPQLVGLLGEPGIDNGADPFTPSGNRRSFKATHYPYTLENIVKVMASQQSERGEGAWGVTAGTLQATAAPTYGSIKDIKADSGRLGAVDTEAYKARVEAVGEQIHAVIAKVKETNKAHTGDTWMESDIIGSVLMDAAQGSKSVNAIVQTFSGEGYTISAQTAQDIQALFKAAAELPTEYFEAKPRRAVGFDEVLAAVVPDDLAQKEMLSDLKSRGVNVLEYQAGDDADRLAKVNTVEGARFSIKSDEEYLGAINNEDLHVAQRNVSDPDIRYSLQEKSTLRAADVKALHEENDLLRERVDYWRGQTRRTAHVTTDKKAVQRAARELIRSYGADLTADDISGELQSLYDYIASGRDGDNELTYPEARRRAESIAQRLVSNAVAVDDEEYRQYNDLRSYLRTTRLTLSEADSQDIPDYGDFRKRNMGRLNLSKGGTNIDRVYRELSDQWPEFFDEQRESQPTDQLLHIAEVLDGIYDISEYNPFSRYMDQAVTGAANEIMETFFDLPQTRKTFADRQADKLDQAKAKGRQQVQKVREQSNARLEELRQKNRQQVQDAIVRERSRRDTQIERLKDRYQARDTAGRERRSAAELRRKITRHAQALSQKLLRPSDKQHIPESLRGPVAAMLEAINQESQYTIDTETGKRRKGEDGLPTKRTEAFRVLKEQYAKIIAEGGDMVIDPSLLGNDAEGISGSFDAVINMRDIRLADMSVSQLATVWQVVKAVEHSVNTAGKVLSGAKYTRTQEWAASLMADTATRRNKRSLTKGHALIDMETPYTFFSHYGEAGKAIYRTLRNAQDQQQLMVNCVAEEVGKVVDPKTVKSLERSTHTFTTERGEKLTLTTAQVMELYELMKRKQAHDHLLKGGIVQPEIKSAHIRRGTDSIRLTEGDLGSIVGTLTDRQVRIADGLQRLTTGLLADYGNAASMAAYGYKKFTGTDYWPIKSAKEGIHSSVERGGNNTRSIKNIGMAKTTTPHANNPLDIAGIFSTFSAHASDMTDYAAWLCPMEDVNRLFNFRFRDGEGNLTGKTVKGILDRVGGPGSQKYWHNLMEDIQNGINTPSDSPTWDIIGRGIGSFKGAAVGGNIRVVVQQPTAFFRATAVLSPADLSRGLARGVTRGNGWKKALQYSPIAMRKDVGSFDISTPRQMSEILFDDRTRVRKVNDALSAPAGVADAVTWGRLWNACEWATAREHRALARGSQEFYQAVNALFTEVIDQTQVVDGVLQRANVMRSSNAVVKQATSFMGEPIMSFNLMLRTYDQVRYEQNSKRRSRAIKTMGRAATALVLTNVVNALAQSLIDALRDDDEDTKYRERFMAAFTGITGDEESAWDMAVAAVFNGNVGSNMNLLGQIPFVKDALSMLQGYDVTRTEMEIISDLIEAGQTAAQSIGGDGKKTRSYAVKELLSAGAKVFGIPVGNLARDVWGLARSITVETDNIPLQYEMEKAIFNITSDKNKGRYYDILFRALAQGDMDSYQHIRDDLMDRMGLDGASIDSAMRSRYKSALEEDPGFTLNQEARDLIAVREQYAAGDEEEPDTFGADDLGKDAYRAYSTQRARDYREMADDLEASPIFRGMDDEDKDKVLKAAYDLANKSALEDASGGRYEVTTKWITLADDAEKAGIEPWEYVLFHAAYNQAESTKDEDGNTIKGESKGDHVREWLEDCAGLTDEQREFLWGTVYQSEW